MTDLTNLSVENRAGFHRSILVAGASILGILLSLHSTQTSCLYIRLVFLLSILLLLSGVLLSAAVLRDLSLLPEQTRKAFAEELQEALLEERDPQWIGVSVRKRTVLCEKWCLISFLSSLLLLVVYTALSLFYHNPSAYSSSTSSSGSGTLLTSQAERAKFATSTASCHSSASTTPHIMQKLKEK